MEFPNIARRYCCGKLLEQLRRKILNVTQDEQFAFPVPGG